MSTLFQKAFDPTTFRTQGHQLIDVLADYLADIQNPSTRQKVWNYIPPDDLFHQYKNEFQNNNLTNPIDFFEKIIHQTTHLHHPKYLGHQTSTPLPLAALGELISGFLDVGMGVYEQGNAGVVLERLIIQLLAQKMKMPIPKADGFLTSGGTLGNLTALLCARSVMIENEVWENGYDGKKYAFLVSEEAHYSVDRAMRVMGQGKTGLVKVPTNDKYQIDSTQLDRCYKLAAQEDIQIIGVIANACSTAVGAHDDIHALADFCEAKKIWLHVDAAHGGGLLFSEKNRHLLDGIERADSVILDFHKMLLIPSIVTAVVFKNGEHSYQTFAQKADYLWANSESREWYNLAKRTFELTKTTMSIRIYSVLKTYGEALFTEYIDRQYGLAKTFAQLIEADGNFIMPVSVPESNIVCFRYLPEGFENRGEEEIDELNLQIRERIIQDGEYFIVQTRVDGKVFLRVTLVNGFTSEKELLGLLGKINLLANGE